jgi:hypothetical protein
VNQELKSHANKTWDPSAVRNVAEQIDKLYWRLTAPENPHDDATQDDGLLYNGDDLSTDEKIALVPGYIDSLFEGSSSEEKKQYVAQGKKLQQLAHRRAELQARLQEYHMLQRALAPFKDPQTSIQPNLPTKDGPLAAELAMTRTLSTRVAVRSETSDSTRKGRGSEEMEMDNDEEEDEDEDEQSKLRRLLAFGMKGS